MMIKVYALETYRNTWETQSLTVDKEEAEKWDKESQWHAYSEYDVYLPPQVQE